MFTGIYDLPWWGYVVYTLVMTHVTIAAVTIYLHRHQSHRSLELHPFASHLFRFWLWLTTVMVTKEWAAINRKHGWLLFRRASATECSASRTWSPNS